MHGLAGQFLCMSCGNFQFHALTYGDSYLPALTSETKKFLNGTCRGHGKLRLLCSEFFRAAIESTRKQSRTCAHKLFDEMRPELGKNMHAVLHFNNFMLTLTALRISQLRRPKRKSF